MAKPLSDRAYVAKVTKDDHHCPVCGADDPEGDGVDIDKNFAFQFSSCGECGSTWTDAYKLSHYTLHHDGTKDGD